MPSKPQSLPAQPETPKETLPFEQDPELEVAQEPQEAPQPLPPQEPLAEQVQPALIAPDEGLIIEVSISVVLGEHGRVDVKNKTALSGAVGAEQLPFLMDDVMNHIQNGSVNVLSRKLQVAVERLRNTDGRKQITADSGGPRVYLGRREP